MVENAEEIGSFVTSKDDNRITGIGKFLRNHKLDELPQLFNVLIGNMSIVGPRPEVPKYVEIFRDDYKKILIVKPGITDPASIKFRNENNLIADNVDPEKYYLTKILPEKIRFYKEYIQKRSIIFDFIVIFKTVISIMKK